MDGGSSWGPCGDGMVGVGLGARAGRWNRGPFEDSIHSEKMELN